MFIPRTINYIWVILSILSITNAQTNEFAFMLAARGPFYVNVTNTQEIKLTCLSIYGNDISTYDEIYIVINHVDTRQIAHVGQVHEKYKERYSYRIISYNHTESVSEFTIKYANKNYATEMYYCNANGGLREIRLRVFYPPTPPTCTSIKSNEVITLTCDSELGKPGASMIISNSTNTYTPTSTVTSDTHITQSVDVHEYRENITCTTTYNFIQKGVTYTTTQSCIFDDVYVTTPSLSTSSPSTSSLPTINVHSTLPTVNIHSTLPTINAHSSSTVAKYSVFTLVIAILSGTI